MTRVVGENFLTCEQTMHTVSSTIFQTVAVYSEADDLRIVTLSYKTNFASNLQKYHPETKVTGMGDAAWFNEDAFDLNVAYGPNVLQTRVGLKGMGGSDVLTVDKKIENAVIGRLGTGG